MKRRFNFTGRKRIAQEGIAINIEQRDDGAPPSFTAEIDLSGLELPLDARVIVEAYSGRAIIRFPWGTVGAMRPPLDRQLVDMPVNPSFRIKVVAADGSGVLLAMANRVRPHREERSGSLVWVEGKDLGHEVWRLSFAGTGAPTLLVNENIAGISDAVRNDKAFRALVMPEVLRAMLVRALLVEGYGLDDDAGDWNELIAFVQSFHAETLPARERDDDEEARKDRVRWIDRAVGAFTERRFHAGDMYAGTLRRA